MSTRPLIDHGTPELTAKRARSQTTEALDILHSKGLLNESELWCALHFRWLYSLRYGAPHVKAVDLTRYQSFSAHTAADEEWRAKRSNEYMQAAHLLNSHKALMPILRIAVFNEPDRASCTELRHSLLLLKDLWKNR